MAQKGYLCTLPKGENDVRLLGERKNYKNEKEIVVTKSCMFVSLLLALMATTLCAQGAQTRAGEPVVDGVKYTVSGGEAQVVGYTGDNMW